MTKKKLNLEHYVDVKYAESCLLKYFDTRMEINLPTYRTNDGKTYNLVVKKHLKKIIDKSIFNKLIRFTGFYQLDTNIIIKQEKSRMCYCDVYDCSDYYKNLK